MQKNKIPTYLNILLKEASIKKVLQNITPLKIKLTKLMVLVRDTVKLRKQNQVKVVKLNKLLQKHLVFLRKKKVHKREVLLEVMLELLKKKTCKQEGPQQLQKEVKVLWVEQKQVKQKLMQKVM